LSLQFFTFAPQTTKMRTATTSEHKSGRVLFIILFTLYLALIIYLCYGNFSNNNFGQLPASILGIPIDKCIHFTMLLPYSFVSFWAFRGKHFVRSLIIVFISGVILSFLLEYGQGILTDYRTTDPLDLMANLLAITTGSLIIALCKLFSRKK